MPIITKSNLSKSKTIRCNYHITKDLKLSTNVTNRKLGQRSHLIRQISRPSYILEIVQIKLSKKKALKYINKLISLFRIIMGSIWTKS